MSALHRHGNRRTPATTCEVILYDSNHPLDYLANPFVHLYIRDKSVINAEAEISVASLPLKVHVYHGDLLHS